MKAFLVAVGTLFSAAALAVIPDNGGFAGGTIIPVNEGPGDQTDPHVYQDFAAYTDSSTGTGVIRYYDFITTADIAIPHSPTDVDTLSDINALRIAFARRKSDRTACMVFDITTNSIIEIAPLVGSRRFQTALGGPTVAFVDNNVGNNDIQVANIAFPNALTNLSNASTIDTLPQVSPGGNIVVWQRCDAAFLSCDIMKSIFAGTWSPAVVVSDTLTNELNPDTDGVYVVYDSVRPSATGQDIYFETVEGTDLVQLEIDGDQQNPSIADGVIAFESRIDGAHPTDVFIYIISSNTMLQITDTPFVSEVLNDVTVSSTGEIRVVWAANSDTDGKNSVYALTLPADGDGDGVADVTDNCPTNANADQADADGDGIGDVCDPNANDGPLGDLDGDGVANNADNCSAIANTNQLNTDGDALGDACDPDDDNDGVLDGSDQCPLVAGSVAGNGCPVVNVIDAVRALIGMLSDPALGLTRGLINSLTTKLNNILESIAAGLDSQAINQLHAFIKQVQSAQKTGNISTQTAATLIAAANAIIGML